MKVILARDIPQIGQRGAVVSVKDGYARNFLIPQGLARIADKEALAQVSRQEQRAQDRNARREEEVRGYLNKLSKTSLVFSKKANKEGHLFAGVSAAEIVEALHTKGFSFITKAHISGVPLKSMGMHSVSVTIGEIAVSVGVEIKSV